MTQSPDHPQEPESSAGTPPPPPPPPPPPSSAYPTAPPITEQYGGDFGPAGAYAGRWARLGAAIIDGIVSGVISWLIVLPIVGGSAMFDSGTKHLGDRLTANAIQAVIAVIYFGFQHGKWGQTIGKRALGIRVVRTADGGAIGYGRAFGRVLFTYVLTGITCGIGGLIDVLWILWDDRRQAVHDKVAGTVVVNADGPDPYATA
jgi:uncharacterized RDD family membrane protein YckC